MINRTKIAVLSGSSNLIWFILTLIWNRYRIALLDGEEAARAWGIYFLVLVGGFILLDILSAIFVMLNEKRSGGQGFEENTDELDRYIERFALKVFSLVFFLSFLISVTILAVGLGLQIFFYSLSFTVLLSGLAMWIVYIVGYERGL
jgi:hypothetical protein